MQAKSTDKKTFQLSENGNTIGELIYASLFQMKAKIKLVDRSIYEIKPVGFFSTGISVTKNKKEIAHLKMNWKGHIVFSFSDDQEYILKAKGFFNGKYIYENKKGDALIQFDPTFNWKKFNYLFDISYPGRQPDPLQVLIGIYAVNYMIATMTGSMGAF